MSPKELKVLKKRRMELMKDSENALKNEDYLLLMQHFKEIIEISDKIDDESIKTEFTEKLEFLQARISQTGTSAGAVANPEQIQEFISDLLLAPQVIIREFSQPIEVAQAVPATGETTVSVPQQPFTPAKPIVLPTKPPPTPSKKPVPAVPPSKTPTPPTKGPPSRAPTRPTKGPPTKAPTRPTKGPPTKAPTRPTKGPPTKAPTLTKPVPSNKMASLPKGVPQPIKPFQSPVKEPAKPYSIPVKRTPKPITPSPMSTAKSGLSAEDMAIEEEIKKLGSVEDQMKELKKILDDQKKKKIKT